MISKRLDASRPGAIETAAQLLRQGEVIVFPTDTLYGVGVDAFNAAAIERLYQVKERTLDKGIPVLLGDVADLVQVAVGVPPLAQQLAARYWPGPLTLIVPRHPNLPANISPGNTVAVRVPNHPVAQALIRAAGGAVATSSANRSGEPGAQTAEAALAALTGRVAAVLDGGPVQHGISSTILDCTVDPPRLLRQGPIPAGALLPEAP